MIEGNWIKKRYMVYLTALLPVLMVAMAAMDSSRLGNGFQVTTNSIRDFFDQQGGSINIIKRIRYYENELRDMKFTSFDNLRTIIFENAIIRNVFDIKVYSGNSVERALYGHSLAHRLSYYEYGSYYLAGHGVGSCYIAELFHDFGYIGVALGNIIYGYILKKISLINFQNYMKDGILLAFIYYLILAPRDNFDGFLGGVFSIYSILGMIIVFSVINLLSKRSKNK